MIAPRHERHDLPAAKRVLVVGMAKSKNNPEFVGPTFDRLAAFCDIGYGEMRTRFDFVNLVDGHPGRAIGGKYDKAPPISDWGLVGQRAAYLYADLLERPRRIVVGLGSFVRDALHFWWNVNTGSSGTLKSWFQFEAGPAGCSLVWSPHPSGTNMWWNDADNRYLGETFWQATVHHGAAYGFAPKAVPMSVRSAWLTNTLESLKARPTDDCVFWPFTAPKTGRPAALYQGEQMPASRVALERTGRPRPDRNMQALHSCDRGVDGCVNPRHLRWGSELENRLDQDERSRGTIGKIGLAAALHVRREMDELAEQLAARYDVTTSAIYAIATGRSWNRDNWVKETT